MDKPTVAQAKEFWEGYGIVVILKKEDMIVGNVKQNRWDLRDHLLYPDGTRHLKYPPIDLNNLFKYAVPKLTGAQKARLPGIFSDNGRLFVFHWFWDNPALALYWALDKVRDEKL